jgi:hypothetical protein
MPELAPSVKRSAQKGEKVFAHEFVLLIEVFGNDLKFAGEPVFVGIGGVAEGHGLIVVQLSDAL